MLSLVCAVLMAAPAGSAAQGVPSDPEGDSPAGVVYEIPAERARKDAAPRGAAPQSENDSGQSGGGQPGSGGSGGGSDDGSSAVGGASDTSIRSDNNFGTSSNVPGAGENGAGGSGDEGSVGDVASKAAASTAASADGPSDGIVFPLLAIVIVAGAGIGIVAGRRALGGRG